MSEVLIRRVCFQNVNVIDWYNYIETYESKLHLCWFKCLNLVSMIYKRSKSLNTSDNFTDWDLNNSFAGFLCLVSCNSKILVVKRYSQCMQESLFNLFKQAVIQLIYFTCISWLYFTSRSSFYFKLIIRLNKLSKK